MKLMAVESIKSIKQNRDENYQTSVI